MTSSIARADGLHVTREQDLLLAAALGRRDQAIEAWQAWTARTDVARLDRDSQWLLPLLYWNLRRHGVDAPRLVRYRNVYLHHWYRNTLALSRLPAGTTTRLTGGAAMAIAYYDSPGVRPFLDLEGGLDAVAPTVSRDRDGHVCADGRRGQWHSRAWCVPWPDHQLVDVILRRDRWDARSRLFWMADAVTLLNRPDLDRAAVRACAASLGALDAVLSVVHVLGMRFGAAA